MDKYIYEEYQRGLVLLEQAIKNDEIDCVAGKPRPLDVVNWYKSKNLSVPLEFEALVRQASRELI